MGSKSFYLANQRHLYYAEIVAYYYKEWQNFHMPFHRHEAIEIMYVISGECSVAFKNEVIVMKKGQFIFIDSDVLHRLIVDGDQSCRMLNIEFVLTDKDGLYPSIKELAMENNDLAALLQAQKPYFMLRDTEGMYYALKSLVLELSDQQTGKSETLIHVLLSQVLLLIARLARSAKERAPQATDMYIKKIIEYIHHNYDRPLHVADLAELVFLHPSYLHRIFKESMNCTLMEYITEVRIEKAKMLLAKTDIPITDISDFIGLNSRQYFSYLFKKHTGETPQSYRKKSIENT